MLIDNKIKRIHWIFFISCICAGIIFYLDLTITQRLQDIVINMFSILAGISIAVLVSFGEKYDNDNENFEQEWDRKMVLLFSYLLTLFLIFISELLSSYSPCFAENIKRIYVSIGMFAFIFSFSLIANLKKNLGHTKQEKEIELDEHNT